MAAEADHLPVLGRDGDYRALIAALQAVAPERGPEVILATAATRDRAALAAIAEAARSLAEGGKDTLLVAAELDRPELRERFGLGLGAGLTDLLAAVERTGKARIERELLERTLNRVEHRDPPGGALHVITTGPRPRSARATVTGRPMSHLLRALRGLDYAHVLVDGPPALSRWVDTTIVVSAPPPRTAREVRALGAVLHELAARPLGLIAPRT